MKCIQAQCLSALSVLAFAGLTGVPAAAQDFGWYLGANAGESSATVDETRIVDDLRDAGFDTTAFKDDEGDSGFKFFGGYRFSRYFALEGGYVDLGNFSFKADTDPAGTLRGGIKIKGVNVDLVGFIPFTPEFAAFGRIGAVRTEAEVSFAGTGAVVVLDPASRERAVNYKLGVGLQFDFTELLAMRVEAERYRVDDALGNDGDVDLISLGVLFRFGGAAHQTPVP